MAFRIFRASFLALVIFQFSVLPQSAFARVTGGAISGTVTEARGSVIRNAEITITSVGDGHRPQRFHE
jgi:hypothetical protein